MVLVCSALHILALPSTGRAGGGSCTRANSRADSSWLMHHRQRDKAPRAQLPAALLSREEAASRKARGTASWPHSSPGDPAGRSRAWHWARQTVLFSSTGFRHGLPPLPGTRSTLVGCWLCPVVHTASPTRPPNASGASSALALCSQPPSLVASPDTPHHLSSPPRIMLLAPLPDAPTPALGLINPLVSLL